jgi:glyoxylase-like metal-dependent hydrolase (beta-lactamase superfamily II)
MVTIVGDGDRIDLGGRTLEVIEIPAHAPSSIAFLDRRERILFSGDEVDSRVMLYWMQDEPQPTIEQHARNMEKLLAHRAEYDHICAGHDLVMADASLVEVYLEHDRRILSGIEGGPLAMRDDGPGDFRMYRIECKRWSEYKGTAIGYDIRYVRDR